MNTPYPSHGQVLRLAGVQVESRNGAVEANLGRAGARVAQAAEHGARLVLCPEFLAPGYIYDRSIWQWAEPRGGATERRPGTGAEDERTGGMRPPFTPPWGPSWNMSSRATCGL